MRVTEQKARELVQEFLTMIREGRFPETVARSVIHAARDDVPSARWSLANRLIMLLNGTTDARGYRQWQAVGRRVKKGVKAFHVLAPRIVKVRVQEEDPETGSRVEREYTHLAGFLMVPVFRYEDTEGEPLPALPDHKPAVLPPLAPLAEKYGVTVKYSPFAARVFGYYSPASQEIVLMSHDVDVFFHELAHAVHLQLEPKCQERNRKEVVAETVAATLCILYGYRGYLKSAADYVAAYTVSRTHLGALKAIVKDVSTIERVLGKILADAAKLVSDTVA